MRPVAGLAVTRKRCDGVVGPPQADEPANNVERHRDEAAAARVGVPNEQSLFVILAILLGSECQPAPFDMIGARVRGGLNRRESSAIGAFVFEVANAHCLWVFENVEHRRCWIVLVWFLSPFRQSKAGK